MEEEKFKISLKAARVNAGLTQAEAAKKVGISISSLVRYEHNPKNIRQKTLDSFYKVYRVPKNFIFSI